jgi:hypothetical protein
LDPIHKLIHANIIGLIPLIIGFGIYPLIIPGLILTSLALVYVGINPFWKNICDAWSQPGFLFFLALLVAFACCYRSFYIPYHPDILQMPWGYFSVLFALSALVIVWISCFSKSTDLIGFIWYFCLGALLFCLLTVALSVIFKKPPFYNQVIDVRYILAELKRYINTPGIANLLCFFPVVFLSGALLEPKHRPKWYWGLGLMGFIFSLVAALAIGQRSYFLICLLIAPLIVSFFLLPLGKWRPALILLALLATYPTLQMIDQLFGIGLLYRPIKAEMLNDARFQMFQFWLDHLIVNPFQRVEVGPAPWDSLQWFHNFFADIHRLSGFWGLLSAVILVSYIFVRLLYLIKLDRRIGLFLMAVAIPCFLIMNTSVVPEGERQPFLLLLAIGAITEVILGKSRQTLRSAGDNQVPGPSLNEG